jgi:hypothetical protein
MRSLDAEQELRRYLQLPVAERGQHGAAFVELAGIHLMELRHRLISRGNRRIKEHGEDIASEVVLEAYKILIAQLKDAKDITLPWRHEEDPMIAWLLALMARILPNYIRRELKHAPPLARSVNEDEFAEADVSAVDGEKALVLKETAEEIPQNSAVPPIFYLKEHQPKLESALQNLPGRDAFLFRIRTGLHRFGELDAVALITLAREAGLGAAVRRKIRQTVKDVGTPRGNTIDPDSAGEFVGISDRQVRNVVQHVVELLEPQLS